MNIYHLLVVVMTLVLSVVSVVSLQSHDALSLLPSGFFGSSSLSFHSANVIFDSAADAAAPTKG